MNLQIFPKEFFQKFSIPYIYISGRRNGQRSRNLLLNSALRKIGQKETEKGQTQAGRRIPGGFSGQGPPARSGSSSPPPPDRPGGKTGGAAEAEQRSGLEEVVGKRGQERPSERRSGERGGGIAAPAPPPAARKRAAGRSDGGRYFSGLLHSDCKSFSIFVSSKKGLFQNAADPADFCLSKPVAAVSARFVKRGFTNT